MQGPDLPIDGTDGLHRISIEDEDSGDEEIGDIDKVGDGKMVEDLEEKDTTKLTRIAIGKATSDNSPAKLDLNAKKLSSNKSSTAKSRSSDSTSTSNLSAVSRGFGGVYELEKALHTAQNDAYQLDLLLSNIDSSKDCNRIFLNAMEPSVVYMLLHGVMRLFESNYNPTLYSLDWVKGWFENISTLSTFPMLWILMAVDQKSYLQGVLRSFVDKDKEGWIKLANKYT